MLASCQSSRRRQHVIPNHNQVLEVRTQGVVGDTPFAAGLSFVVLTAFEHKPRVAAAPCPHRFAALQRRHEHLTVSAQHARRQIVELQIVGPCQRDGALDHALEFEQDGDSKSTDVPNGPGA